MKIEFTTTNAAFDEGGDILETMRILQKIRNEVAIGYKRGVVMDINGNKIGKWSFDEGKIQ